MTIRFAPSLRTSLRNAVLPLAVAAALAAPGFALAQDAATEPAPETTAPAAEPAAQPQPGDVVATVGASTITEADLAFAAEDLAQDLQQVPPEQRRAFLVTVLIDMKVMAQAARDAQLQETEDFKQRLSYLEDRALRRAFFAEKIAAGVTPESVQAAYDQFVAGFVPAEEVHARHILVATKEEADAVKAELTGGKTFEVLAMEKSTDPSAAQNGGDLGFFSRGMMVPQFEEVAFALEVGAISDPVQSQFGWHVIKLEEKRMSSPPPFEQLAPQLQQQVLLSKFDETVSTLKQGLTVDIPDTALAAQVQAQAEAPTQ
jgi:peptidyl-prolyl cis-trans isomerase C